MDQLRAMGLHIDEKGLLRILPEENELHSVGISLKCKALIEGE